MKGKKGVKERVTRASDQEKRGEKNGRTFTIHPLFLMTGIYACCTRSLPLYLCAAAVAVQHEFAHSLAAARAGFRLQKIVLMPYGAVIRGDLSGAPLKEEILIAAAGPLCNVCTAFFFLGLWWLYPDTYPYTEAAFYLSLYVGVGNLLPFFPLDGGRILRATIEKKAGKKRAERICRAVTLAFSSCCLCAAFVAGFYTVVPPTVYAFPVFLLCGAASFGGEYRKIQTDYAAALSRGLEEKIVAIDGQCTVKRALSFLESGKFVKYEVYTDGKKAAETDERALFSVLSGSTLYSSLIALPIFRSGREKERTADSLRTFARDPAADPAIVAEVSAGDKE